MAKKPVYSYSKDTGFYNGVLLAVESPLERGTGRFIIPAYCTEIEPPEPVNGKERIFDGEAWAYVDVVRVEDTGSNEGVSDPRIKRNTLLAACDWTQLPDVPSWVNVQAWRTYRQKLRDITTQTGFPDRVEWPTPPQAETLF